jgi:outer membrane protein OmpA-like peptidoglycan-associated protein
MAPSINRTAVFLNLATFLAFVLLCEVTQAPMIQEDVLKRCQDAFMAHGIPIQGLSVEGRDVVLRGLPQSEIVSSRTYSLAAGLSGVRAVRTDVVKQMPAPSEEKVAASAASERQREIQDRIDGLLGKQKIDFRPDGAQLTLASEKVLDEASRYLSEAPSLRCEIWVYANESPAARQSVMWAMLRALSTEDYLIGKGIAEWRLSTYALREGDKGQDGAQKVGQEESAVPAAPASSLSFMAGRRRLNRTVDLVVRAR